MEQNFSPHTKIFRPSKSRQKSHLWAIKDSLEQYNIARWGNGYFGINAKGHMTVSPLKEKTTTTIDIMDVLSEAQAQGLQLPAVIRFQDILKTQVQHINHTFSSLIEEAEYQGSYIGVYPVKVNQMREVVEEIIEAGMPYHFGLEAGSKAEILAALSLNTVPEALTILNGYKDDDYIELALLGRKLGRKVVIVIEKLSELAKVIAKAQEMNIRPIIGLRSRLSCRGEGKWCGSSGERAKFGLTVAQILQAVKILKDHQMADCLKLFHFHIGSQVTNIQKIKDAITEGARMYAKLYKMDIKLQYFDVGGGLAVDYDGSNSTYDSSMNYLLKDYIADVVYNLKEICDLEEVPHPDIVSETGRAITAYHSCVVMNVFGNIDLADSDFPTDRRPDHHHLVNQMREIYIDTTANNLLESYHDAVSKKDEALQAFKLGVIDLEERAIIETLYWKCCKKIIELAMEHDFPPSEILALNQELIQQYLCNFSVFQSAADSWAIGQVLPVIPLTRLNEKPTINTILADITCDSDGKIDKFVGPEGRQDILPLHRLNGDKYYLGLFLTGAYQDIMGDNHNLFGRLNEIHVHVDQEDPKGFYINEVIRGNTSAEILSMLQYAPMDMGKGLKKEIDQKVAQGLIRPRDGVALFSFYQRCLKQYTYLT